MSRNEAGNFGSMFAFAAAAIAAVLSTPATALTNAEIATLKGPDRQNVLLTGAKKEGKVALYTSLQVNGVLRPLLEAFDKKYPGIKAEYFRGGSVEIIQKISAEVRAKNVFADVMEGGGGALPAIKGGFVESYDSPVLEVFKKSQYHPQGLWMPSRVNYYGMAYNTKLIQPEQMAKTYDQLLDPRWKGKLAWSSSSQSGAFLMISNLLDSRGEKATGDYLAKLAKQEIIDDPSGLENVEAKVIQGEYEIGVHVGAHNPIANKKKGAPTDTQMMEPVSANINTIQMIKGAPHPHAAVLFMDFMIGAEGQSVMREGGYLSVNPQVDPAPEMHKIVPRLSNMKEYYTTPESVFEMNEKAIVLFKKYFP